MQRQGFTRTAVLIHWILAVSILFLFLSSWWMMGLPLPSPDLQFRALPFQLHKNIGLTLAIFLLTLLYVRLKYRPAPPGDRKTGSQVHLLAVVTHVLIYLSVFALCVTGYLASAHTRWDTVFWWMIRFPRIAAPNEELNELWSDLHIYSSWLLLGLVAVHVTGAIYHSCRKDGVVRRMICW